MAESAAVADRDSRPVLTVFFEGTANTLQPITTQIGIFAKYCQAHDVSNGAVHVPMNLPDESSEYQHKSGRTNAYKMAFDGCGVTNGTMGTLFAAGLDAQCDAVIRAVDAILQRQLQLASLEQQKETGKEGDSDDNDCGKGLRLVAVRPSPCLTASLPVCLSIYLTD